MEVIVQKTFRNGAEWVKPGMPLTVADARGKELVLNRLARPRVAGDKSVAGGASKPSARRGGRQAVKGAAVKRGGEPADKRAPAPSAPPQVPVANKQRPAADTGRSRIPDDKAAGDGPANA